MKVYNDIQFKYNFWWLCSDQKERFTTECYDNFLWLTVFEFSEIRTYVRTYETSENGFRDGKNGYFRWNLKIENFLDYNTSFTSYKEVKKIRE